MNSFQKAVHKWSMSFLDKWPFALSWKQSEPVLATAALMPYANTVLVDRDTNSCQYLLPPTHRGGAGEGCTMSKTKVNMDISHLHLLWQGREIETQWYTFGKAQQRFVFRPAWAVSWKCYIKALFFCWKQGDFLCLFEFYMAGATSVTICYATPLFHLLYICRHIHFLHLKTLLLPAIPDEKEL